MLELLSQLKTLNIYILLNPEGFLLHIGGKGESMGGIEDMKGREMEEREERGERE